MPTTTRRHVHRPSSESDPSSTEFASGAPSVRSEARDSLENDDHDEPIPATLPGIIRQLMVLQRQMEHNFGDLHNGLRDTNTRLNEQSVQLGQLKAQQINQRATHINNPIQPVGRDDGTPISTELSRRYKHVHDFLRLKRRDNWQVLAELHIFYGSESWSTWGFNPMSSWDESDVEEPLMTHNTLEDAISWAPDDALQDIARHLGLNYEKIMTHVEEYESLQQRRATQNKRVAAGDLASSKRGKLSIPERQEAQTSKQEKVKQPASTDSLSGKLEWDTRVTEDRTPESQRPRVKDAPPTFSSTSVATSDDQLPARTKR
nr:hypothetical protein B0A51_03366 [Rachicladosporium sp. CCFEE 5018]